MRLMICVDTAGAEDGFEEDERPTFDEHRYDIGELLRSGYYEVEYIDECKDGE